MGCCPCQSKQRGFSGVFWLARKASQIWDTNTCWVIVMTALNRKLWCFHELKKKTTGLVVVHFRKENFRNFFFSAMKQSRSWRNFKDVVPLLLQLPGGHSVSEWNTLLWTQVTGSVSPQEETPRLHLSTEDRPCCSSVPAFVLCVISTRVLTHQTTAVTLNHRAVAHQCTVQSFS